MKKSTNNVSLVAYASDGSIYRVDPKQVWTVTNSRDIAEALKYASENNLTITPRGAGTGLAGGALGPDIILDFGSFRQVLAVDPYEKYVISQVGIIYEELNASIKNYGLFFPPDPSSGDTCQIGGMIANNSSGPRSVKYGLTSNFLEELGVYKPDGRLIYLKKFKLDSVELNTFFSENKDYAHVFNLLKKNSELIKKRWPKLKKNSAGYNLLQVVSDFDNGIFNLPALIAGSEGTLAITASAKLRLLEIPTDKLTIRIYFKSLIAAGQAVSDLLKIEPSGLEIVDGATLGLIGRDKFDIPDEAGAMLLMEFDDEIDSKRERFLEFVDGLDLAAPVDFAHDSKSAAPLWKARKAIVPTLYRHHKTKRPVSLIEDVSLPPDHIPGFIEYVTALFKKYNLTFGIFGHIGDGNLHIRPLFDLNNENEYKLAQEIYAEVYDKVISLGGSTTAEHADGRLRASLLKKLYGDEVYDIFLRIKNILDPNGILSPDSVISTKPFTENIDFEKIKSYCAACGKCNGYCPAYRHFRREDYGARGWLRIINQSGASRSELNDFLSYCLNCKNCTIVCPAGVKISDDIMSWRAQNPGFMSKAVIAITDNQTLLSLGLKLGKLVEPIVQSGFGKSVIATVGKMKFGWDKTFEPPKIANHKLRDKYRSRFGDSGKVGLFHGCADNLFESNFGEALFKVFDYFNIEVKIPNQKCCGLPHEVYGHRDNMIEKAKYNIDRLLGFESVITGCASCLEKLKEYPELFDESDNYHSKAVALRDKCYDVSQYLNMSNVDLSAFQSGPLIKLSYHNPCHLRAAGLHKEPERLIGRLDNVKLLHPDHADRCCAQSGSYGYTHFQESKAMFAEKKEEYYRLGAEYIMTSCPSCRMKVKSELGGNYKVVHPVEILALRLDNRSENNGD